MKLNFTLLLMVLIHSSTRGQNVENDSIKTEKIIVKTKYGNLTLTKSCLQNFSYYRHLADQPLIIDEEVFIEAEKRKIKEDLARVLFTIDENGLFVKFRIELKGKLDKLNEFIEKFCSEVILQSKLDNIYSKVNCLNGNRSVFSVPFYFK